MNRLERIELLDRVKQAETKAGNVQAQLDELSARIAALEQKPRLGRPPKATDGNGLREST